MSSEYYIRIQKINILHTVYIVHVTHSMSSTVLVCYSKRNQETLNGLLTCSKSFFFFFFCGLTWLFWSFQTCVSAFLDVVIGGRAVETPPMSSMNLLEGLTRTVVYMTHNQLLALVCKEERDVWKEVNVSWRLWLCLQYKWNYILLKYSL